MIIVTPYFAFCVFIGILVISAIAAYLLKDYHNYDKGAFHTFISVLMGLGVFVTFMFYYAIVSEQQQQRQVSGIQTLATVNANLVNYILKQSDKSVTVIPNFILSINPLTSGGEVGSDPDTPQAITMKNTLAYRIFSVWQDIMLTKNLLVNYEQISYLCNFLQRANSEQLFEIWKLIKIDYTVGTQKFGDLLFEYALPITEQLPESYVRAAEQMVKDPRFLALF